MSDYSEDAILISPAGIRRGKSGVREASRATARRRSQCERDLKTQLYADDTLLLDWAAESSATAADDGIDTFIFRDGLIRVQTVRYTLQKK